jgi:hypothetical protein
LAATAIDCECVFSRSQILLSHVQNRMAAETIRALMCVGEWSRKGYIKARDIKAVTMLPELEGEDEFDDALDGIY